jgi:spermidine synthase
MGAGMINPLYANSVTMRPALLWGRVLLLGLGVGDMVPVILKHRAITELVAIELDQRVIDRFRLKHKKLTIVRADAYEYYGANQNDFDFICQDLWDKRLGNEHWIKIPKGVQLWEIG